jgi:hypothetical protein
MRTWTRLTSAVLLTLALFCPTLRAADPPETNAQKIEQLQKEVAQLQKDVLEMRKDLLDNAARRNATAEQLARIQELLERMALQQGVIRQAGFDPRSVAPGGAPATTATITLQNTYLAPATVRINGQSYRVSPGQTLPIAFPIGTIQYSVDVDGTGTLEPLRTDTLQPAGYRINIHFLRMPL